MQNSLFKFGRLGTRQRIGLATSGFLVVSVAGCVLASEPDLALVPLSILMLLVLLQLAITQIRLTATKRSLDRLHFYHRSLRHLEQANKRSHVKDYQHELERLEFLQQRILATIETERLETAERFNVLESKLH